MSSQIVIQNLSVQSQGSYLLKDVSITIPNNKITVIIGPSGCGKSTLLKCMNRMIDLENGVSVSGSILIDGLDILNTSIDVYEIRRKIGMIAQNPVVLPMSIFNNVAYGPRIHHDPQDSELNDFVRYSLEQVGLWDEVRDRLNAPASVLSVGQKQRLCLARALAVRPEVLLCDETTSALDPISAKIVEEELLLLKEKYSIVFVTHILRQAKRLADYVFFLYLGEIIEHGDANTFFSLPSHSLTKAYIDGNFT